MDIRNTSEEWVEILPFLAANQVITNGHSYNDLTIRHMNYTLKEDMTIDGNLTMDGSITLDLNGSTLTVNGNLLHKHGTLKLNGGTLIVKGDYISDNYGTYNYSYGYLYMTNPNDYMLVEGNFLMDSYYSHEGKLTAGTLEVKGNFTQRATSVSAGRDNFNTSGTHKVILSGTAKQTVSFTFPYASDSHFNVLDIRNTSAEGVTFITGAYVIGNLTATICQIPLDLTNVTYGSLNLSASCIPSDIDGDGILDRYDDDMDGDSVLNEQDAFPRDSSEWQDSDGDGTGDNADEMPNDPNEHQDTDGDGIGNNADTDDDGDGISDEDEIKYGLNPLDGSDADGDIDDDGTSDKDEINAGTYEVDCTLLGLTNPQGGDNVQKEALCIDESTHSSYFEQFLDASVCLDGWRLVQGSQNCEEMPKYRTPAEPLPDRTPCDLATHYRIQSTNQCLPRYITHD